LVEGHRHGISSKITNKRIHRAETGFAPVCGLLPLLLRASSPDMFGLEPSERACRVGSMPTVLTRSAGTILSSGREFG